MKIHSCPILPHTVVLILDSVLVQEGMRRGFFLTEAFANPASTTLHTVYVVQTHEKLNEELDREISKESWVHIKLCECLLSLYIRPRRAEMSVEDLWDNHLCVLQWVASSVHGRATLQANICLSSFINVSSDILGLLNFDFNCTGVIECMIIPLFTDFSLTSLWLNVSGLGKFIIAKLLESC